MIQDISTKYGHKDNLTRGLSPCEAPTSTDFVANEVAARCQRSGGSSPAKWRLVVSLFLLLLVGVNTAWGAKMDYWFFIVNKSGKIVTYAKSNLEQNNNVNGNQIPAAIKSVNATNWRLYNGDQLASDLTSISLPDQLPQVTQPTASTLVDCSSWGTVTLVSNPETMSKLSNCESSTRYPNCIFVFCDYDVNSLPDLRNGIYYTMQFRGGYTKNNVNYDPTNCFLYYNTSNNRMASTANYVSDPVTNPVTSEEAENDSKYLWCFKAAEVGGVVDPYDVKIYNAYVGIGDNDYFVANPLDAGDNGQGSGPENENNKLQPASVLTTNRINSYYVATSYYSNQYNITGKPAYNYNKDKETVRSTVYYNLWAEYQHNGRTPANISKGGITSQSNFQRTNNDRRNFASIILTKVSKTYIIVDASGNTIAQALTLSNTLDVPDVIKSPFASYTYYSSKADAIAGTNPINSVTSTTIYVRYTTQSGDMDFNGETSYFICTNGNYLYASNSTTLGIESSLSNPPSNTRKWRITGNDAYQLTLQNVDNSQYVTYNVSSGESVPTLSGTGSKFFLHQSSSGQYEVVAITTDYYSTNYYSLGVANSTLKLYSSSNYAMGDDEVQSDIYSRPTCATPDIAFDNATGQVTITCATEGATIHYTTNGDTPTESSPSTPNPFTINAATTVKAIATQAGYLTSEVVTLAITQVATPTITINADNSVTIACTTDGATIYYKTGGDDPTTANATQSASIASILPSQGPIKAFATKDGCVHSNIVTESNIPAKTITVSSSNGLLTSTDPIVYDGTAHQPAFTIKDGEAPVSSAEYSSAYSDNTNAGTATITITDNENGDYVVSGSFTFTIEQKDLSITARPKAITYGDAPANDGVSYSGFIEGESENTVGVFTGTLSYVYSYSQYDDVGNTYTITPGGLTATNYAITFVAGTLTVNQRETDIEWGNTALGYNGSPQTPTATATNVVNNDEVTVTVTGAQTNVGTDYTATATGFTGTKAGNYVLVSSNTTTTFSIGAGTFTPTVSIDGWIFGEASNAPSVSGNMSGGDVTYTYSVKGENNYSSTVPTNAGDYTVKVAIAASGNYDSAEATKDFTISPKSIGDGKDLATDIDIKIEQDGDDVKVTYVKDGETTLVENLDYAVVIQAQGDDNHVTVTGIGNYTGSAQGLFVMSVFTKPTGATEAASVYQASSDLAKPNDITPYIVRKVNPSIGTMVITPIDYIPKDVPVLMLRTGQATGFLASPKEDATAEITAQTKNSNLLKVAPEDGVGVEAAQVYMFYLGEFVLTKKGTISNGKFFLYNPNYTATPPAEEGGQQGGSGNAPSLSTLRFVIEEEPTGIVEMRNEKGEMRNGSDWFTLDGRKLNDRPTKPGLYIWNGRKTIIKRK